MYGLEKTPLRCILSQRDYFGVVGDLFRRNVGRGDVFQEHPDKHVIFEDGLQVAGMLTASLGGPLNSEHFPADET